MEIGSVALVLLVLAIVFVIKTINVVPQQHAWVVERLGKYHTTLGPGLNIVVPFIDRIAYKRACKNFCVNRGHEIIPKGICHDRYDDHEKTSQKERTIPISS
jgi:hypothetical protein